MDTAKLVGYSLLDPSNPHQAPTATATATVQVESVHVGRSSAFTVMPTPPPGAYSILPSAMARKSFSPTAPRSPGRHSLAVTENEPKLCETLIALGPAGATSSTISCSSAIVAAEARYDAALLLPGSRANTRELDTAHKALRLAISIDTNGASSAHGVDEDDVTESTSRGTESDVCIDCSIDDGGALVPESTKSKLNPLRRKAQQKKRAEQLEGEQLDEIMALEALFTQPANPAPPHIEGRSDTHVEDLCTHEGTKLLTLAFKYESTTYLEVSASLVGSELLALLAAHLSLDPSLFFVHRAAPLRLDLSLAEQGIHDAALFFITRRVLGGARINKKDRTAADWRNAMDAAIAGQEERSGKVHPGTLCPREQCQNRTDKYRTGWSGTCSFCSWQDESDPKVAAKRKAQREADYEISKKRARGETVERKRKWPRINHGPKFIKAQKKADADQYDFDGDATDSDDDYDDDGRYNRKAVPMENDDEEDEGASSIVLPDCVPGTDVKVPDIAAVRRNMRRVLWAHIKNDCEWPWTPPPQGPICDGPNGCGAELDWLKGDHITTPYVKAGRWLITEYKFGGLPKLCRLCSIRNLRDWNGTLNKDDENARRMAAARTPLGQLFHMANGIIIRNRAHECKLKVKAENSLDFALDELKHKGQPVEIIGAFLLDLAERGGVVSGTALIEHSFNYLNKDKLEDALKVLQNVECAISGISLNLLAFEALYNKPSPDRLFPHLPYFHRDQELLLVSWAFNFALLDLDTDAREDFIWIAQNPNVELASLVLSITEFMWTERHDDDDDEELEREADVERRARATALGWNPTRAAKRAQVKAAVHSQGERDYVEGRPGVKYASTRGSKPGFLLDRRAWDASVVDIDYDDPDARAEASQAHLEIAKPFHDAHGNVCAVTGYLANDNLSLEYDRLTDDLCYSVENCWMVLGPVNRFKATLPQFRTLRALMIFIEDHPGLKNTFDDEGLKVVSAHIIRQMLNGDNDF